MQSNWQVPFFRGVALDAWRYVTTTEMTRGEVDFLERALNIQDGAELLDTVWQRPARNRTRGSRLQIDGPRFERGVYRGSAPGIDPPDPVGAR
jgi:hypothetical protein